VPIYSMNTGQDVRKSRVLISMSLTGNTSDPHFSQGGGDDVFVGQDGRYVSQPLVRHDGSRGMMSMSSLTTALPSRYVPDQAQGSGHRYPMPPGMQQQLQTSFPYQIRTGHGNPSAGASLPSPYQVPFLSGASSMSPYQAQFSEQQRGEPYGTMQGQYPQPMYAGAQQPQQPPSFGMYPPGYGLASPVRQQGYQGWSIPITCAYRSRQLSNCEVGYGGSTQILRNCFAFAIIGSKSDKRQ